MKYRYNLLILIQVLLIALTPALFWLALRNPALVFTRFAILLIWIAQIGFLFYTIKASDRDLKRFVKIIANEDEYHLLSKRGWLRPNTEMIREINAVISSFRNLKMQKESDLLFFKLVMEHTPVGIMAVSLAGKIVSINKAAKELFEIEDLIEINQLEKTKTGLTLWFRNLPSGQPITLRLDLPSRSLLISVVVTEIKIMNEEIRLFSMKDIKHELYSSEMETLQRMMRLLSHEVVNSISPISLLATSVRRSIKELSSLKKTLTRKSVLADIDLGLTTIHKRSMDLNDFVGSIKTLTTVPELHLECVKMDYLVQQSAGLMKPQLDLKGLNLIIEVGDQEIFCDRKLIVQVLINLIKNSLEAMQDYNSGYVRITGEVRKDHHVIMVEDNGPGIADNIREEIFSPFFTTKSTGSGIGLSFSRQVMTLHKGDITLWSESKKTIFSLMFPFF